MFKLFLIFLVIKVVAAATGKDQGVITYKSIEYYSNNTHDIDGYIMLNEYKNIQNIRNCDVQMEIFRQKYTGQINTINTTLDILVASVVETEERVKFLEMLSDLSRSCVKKYRPLLPHVADIKREINDCIKHEREQVDVQLENPLALRNALNSYYKYNFEDDIYKCKQLNNSNTTRCIFNVVSYNNNYTLEIQEAFDLAMDSAECSAKINIKKALGCSFIVRTRTISLISKTNTLIDNCIRDPNICMPYGQNCYSCPYVDYVQKSQVHEYYLDNPFYQTNNIKPCQMLYVN